MKQTYTGGLTSSRCCGGSGSLTTVFAGGQDVFGHLETPAHVILIRLRHSELANGNQRPGQGQYRFSKDA